MSNRILPPASIVVLLVFAGATTRTLSAQGPAQVIPVSQYQGPYAGQPVGLQLAGTTFANLPAQVIRTAGIASGSPRGWSASTFGAAGIEHPDYSAEALYAHWVPTLLGQTSQHWSSTNPWQQPDLGGFSTGGDVTPPVNSNGRLMTGGTLNPAWYSLSFAVDRDAEGKEGSAVAQAGGNPGGWVFTYFDEGSQLIRGHLVNSIVVDYTRPQLAPGETVSPDTSITGLDWGMGTISSTVGGTPSPLVPNRSLLYFAIDKAWIGTYYPGPGPWRFTGLDGLGLGAQPTQIDLDPGTVYAMAWNGSSWSAPAVALDHVALYGSAQSNVAIDALSVFKRPADPADSPSTVVFSLEPDSKINGQWADQILVTQLGSFSSGLATATAQTLRTTGGTIMSSKLGLLSGPPSSSGPDDVDGLCGLDPDGFQSRDPFVGCPVDELHGPGGSQLGLSVFRLHDGAVDMEKAEELVVAVTGIDLSGFALGLLQLDFEDVSVPFPQHPITFSPGITSPPVLLFGDMASLEFRFPVGDPKGNELRLRARIHTVTSSLSVQMDHETSWVTAIGQP